MPSLLPILLTALLTATTARAGERGIEDDRQPRVSEGTFGLAVGIAIGGLLGGVSGTAITAGLVLGKTIPTRGDLDAASTIVGGAVTGLVVGAGVGGTVGAGVGAAGQDGPVVGAVTAAAPLLGCGLGVGLCVGSGAALNAVAEQNEAIRVAVGVAAVAALVVPGALSVTAAVPILFAFGATSLSQCVVGDTCDDFARLLLFWEDWPGERPRPQTPTATPRGIAVE